MFWITVDALIRENGEKYIYYPGNSDMAIYDCKLTKTLGEYGELEFSVPNKGQTNYIEPRALVFVYRDGDIYWRGFIDQILSDMYGNMKVYCKEDLAWLSDVVTSGSLFDSTTSTGSYKSTIINWLMNEFNNVTNDYPRLEFGFALGNIYNPRERIHAEIQKYSNIYTELKKYVGENCFLNVRRESVNHYLDIVNLDSMGHSGQTIDLGVNLMDYVKEINTNNMVNILEYCAIYYDSNGEKHYQSSVRTNKDLNSIAQYGIIQKYIEFERTSGDTTYISEKGAKYLSEHCEPEYTFEISALDLSALGTDADYIDIGDSVTVNAEGIGLSGDFRVIELTQYLQEPHKNIYRISNTFSKQQLITQLVGKGK